MALRVNRKNLFLKFEIFFTDKHTFQIFMLYLGYSQSPLLFREYYN